MNFLERQKKIEEIVAKYQDIIGADAKKIAGKLGISTSESNAEALKKIEDENRLLQLGIVGRVKAGKSSLLNALLFDGRTVLPKAATPMTAALTILSYGDKVSAEVEFFSKKDIDNIRRGYNEYIKEKNRLIEQYKMDQKKRKQKKLIKGVNLPVKNMSETEIEEKAIKKANRELKDKTELVVCYEQYEKIKQSGMSIENVIAKKNKNISADSLSALSKKLTDYVGANGKYTPFTKSVHIKIPDEKLKDIQIVDTPGVNDPVVSREEKTKELLKQCEAILIVSPSGQFINQDDIDLMDRITTKEGVRELFVVASQIDNQLFGHIKNDSNGDLHKALDLVVTQLAEHMHDTLVNLKNDLEKNGCSFHRFEQLIEESRNRVIHSSGISQTIINSWDSQEKWDNGVKTVWDNLKKNYPDYFSDKNRELSIENLKRLANIERVNQIIYKVREKKDEIFKKRKEDFIKAKNKSLDEYIQELLKCIETKISDINEADLEELKKEEAELKNLKSKMSTEVDFEYEKAIAELELSLKNTMIEQLNKYFKETKKKINSAKDNETIEREVSDSVWYKPWTWGDSHTEYDTYTTVFTGAVREALEDFTSNIENSVENKIKEVLLNWREATTERLIHHLRLELGDKNLEPYRVKQAILNVFAKISYPEVIYTGSLPDDLKKTGTLKRSSAEEFLSSAYEYVSNLRSRVKKDINNYIKKLIGDLKSIKISSSFIEEYQTALDELQKLIKEKEYSLDRLNRFRDELQTII